MAAPHADTAQEQLAREVTAGNPWLVAAKLRGRLELEPHDADAWLNLARVMLRLGLRTPGLEALEAARAGLAAGGAAFDSALDALAEGLGALKDDRIEAEARVAVGRANAGVLAARGALPEEVAAGLDAWAKAAAATQAFRTSTGAVVVREARGGAWTWSHWLDDVSMARGIVLTGLMGTPIHIDGVHAPAVVKRLIELTGNPALGMETPVTLLAGSARELLDGLSLADLRPELGMARVRVIVGLDVPARLEAEWRARPEEALGLVVGVPLRPRQAERWAPGATAAAMERAKQFQQHEIEATIANVKRMYAGRGPAWWARRFEAARAGRERPLRVLIPTTRYSTFVQHSAADLGEALREAGCEVLVHKEAGATVQHSGLAIPLAVERFEPDVVAMINATRARVGAAIPAELPVVTWCQDALPHLFDEKSGRAVGAIDVFCGHLIEQLFTQFAYPRERAFSSMVVASARKFHGGAVPGPLREEHTCDIAYVSHQSETPERMRDRKIAEARSAGNALLPDVIAEIYDEVAALAGAPARGPFVDSEIGHLVQRVLRRMMGPRFDSRVSTTAVYTFVRPLADRVIRHQTLEWARQISARRGWKLALYGKGWHEHPTLAPFARGEVMHDESLRALYQAARVHLHVSINGFMHQRVIECALSGGLPLVRINRDSLASIAHAVSERVSLRHDDPEWQLIADRSCWMHAGRDEEAMKLAALMAAWGVSQEASIRLFPGLRDRVGADGRAPVPSEDVAWMLGPACELGFDSIESLERALERAIEPGGWREARAAALRDVAQREFTHDVLATRMLTSLERAFERSVRGVARPVPVS